MKKAKILSAIICCLIFAAFLYGCGSENKSTLNNDTLSQNITDNKDVSPAAGTTSDKTDATQNTANNNTAVSGTSQEITEETAKQIALDHAGLKESDVLFIRVALDRDDRRTEYEVEFYSGNIEYDYDIDASTGEIISYDYDAEYYDPSTGIAPGENFINSDKAQEIALNHAGLNAQDIQFIKTDFDYDDGRGEYEIEFYYGMVQYDYTIDATTGDIISFEKDMD